MKAKKTAGIRKMPAAGYGVPTRFWGEDWVGICGLRNLGSGLFTRTDGIHAHKSCAEVISGN